MFNVPEPSGGEFKVKGKNLAGVVGMRLAALDNLVFRGTWLQVFWDHQRSTNKLVWLMYCNFCWFPVCLFVFVQIKWP